MGTLLMLSKNVMMAGLWVPLGEPSYLERSQETMLNRFNGTNMATPVPTV